MSKRKSLEQLLNDIAVFTVYDYLKRLCLDCFVWEGLPKDIKPIYIEEALFMHGQVALFDGKFMSRPDPGNLVALPCSFANGRNIYGEPLAYNAFGLGVTATVPAKECVNIRNNANRTNMHEIILSYAYRIADVDRTADVNVRQCKTPTIFHTTPETELSMREMQKQIDKNVLAIFANKKFDMEDINTLELTKNLREYFICADLMDYRNTLLNQVLTIIGINNLPVDKKERSLVDEVNSNNDFIFNNIDERLQWRENACEEAKKIFSKDITVKLKHEQADVTPDPDSEEAITAEMERDL